MPPILLDWFDVQQQTSTLRPQNCGCFYVKFSAESNGHGIFFSKEEEVANKMAKTKVVRKPPNGVVQRLRVKRQVQTPGRVQKEGSVFTSGSFLTF